MQLLKRHPGRLVAAVAGVALLAACTDKGGAPLGPVDNPGGPPAPPAKPITVQMLDCTGSLKDKTVTCAPQGASGGDASSDIIIGGPNGVYVKLTTSNVNYDGGLGRLTFDATVRNLIPQPIGTTDGTNPAASGVRVFIVAPPAVTAGTGAITVPTPDGTAIFTAPGQVFYQYNGVLDQYELSTVKQWRMDMPATVTTFTFNLAVSAPVQFPNGWVEMQPAVHSMPALDDRAITAFVRNALGEPLALPVTWGTSDAGTAIVDPTGLVVGVRAGTATITATAGPGHSGGMTMNISGIKRTWTGAVNTNWDLPANWIPINVLPHPQADTAVIPGDLVNYPLFTSNEGIGGVIMQNGTTVQPFINIGSFDFTLNSSIDQDTNGQITGTGRMLFTGIALISGGVSNVDYRNLRITESGRVSLDTGTNLNVTGGRIVVQGGRLRNEKQRVRVRPN